MLYILGTEKLAEISKNIKVKYVKNCHNDITFVTIINFLFGV